MNGAAAGTRGGAIGFSSCCFPPAYTIEQILHFCLDHEFGAFEIEVNSTNFDPEVVSSGTLDWIQSLSTSGTVKFSVHSPGNINFSDPDSRNREDSERSVIAALELASRLHVATVVVHPGRVVGDFSAPHWQTAIDQNVSAIRRCAQRARELGVKVSVENLCHEKGSVNPKIADFLDMCRVIDLSLIGITLDTNHAALVDGLDDTIRVIGEYVNHIHFSSNKGVRSDHCEPAAGVIDFHAVGGFFRQFSGLNIIELNESGSDSGPAVLRTRAFLEQLLQPSEATT
jgi:sugar phosphate isomerase/epimerase